MSTVQQGLSINRLVSGYPGIDVVREVDLEVRPGEVVTVFGANGAGKSTLLNTIMGVVDRRAGTIDVDGRPLPAKPREATKRGVAIVPQGRRVFARRTVADNLLIGGWVTRASRTVLAQRREASFERFPALRRRADQPAGSLSGGEAQMLAIGMALMAEPSLLLLDEPSLGLAPVVVDSVLSEVRALADDGMGVLLVEQVVNKALRVSDRGAVLKAGRIVKTGTADELRQDDDIAAAYLGAGSPRRDADGSLREGI